MADANWIKGKGTAGIKSDPNISATAKAMADSEDAEAKSAVAAALGGVTKPAEDAVIEACQHFIALSPSATPVSLKDLAARAGCSVSFINFVMTRKSQLSANGIETSSLTKTSVVLKTAGTVATPVATPAAPAATAPSPATPPSSGRPPVQSNAPSATTPSPATPGPVVAGDPDYFYMDPRKLAKLRAIVRGRRNMWLAGPTGCGKSEFYERGLATMNLLGFAKVNFHGESSVDDLLGHYTIRDGNTVWVEGALAEACKKGIPLILEEGDAAPAEANFVLHRVLEIRPGKPRSFYNARNGETVVAEEGFCVLTTGNSRGGGDHTGLYTGVQAQNAAFRDRYAYEELSYPPKDVEVTILIKRTGIGRMLAEKVVEFADSARKALVNGTLFTPVSTRTLVEFGLLVALFETEGLARSEAVQEAMRSAVTLKAASPSDEAALLAFQQRIFGSRP